MAASNVVMPQMGYDMTQGKILRWIKHEGDQVQRGEAIAEIETDKVNIEIEAFASGTLLKISVPEGETVPVGQAIGVIGQPGDSVAEAPKPEGEMPRQEQGAGERAAAAPTQVDVRGPGTDAKVLTEDERGNLPAMEPQPAGAQPSTSEEDRVKASPVARRFAQEQGIPLNDVQGTGPGGRITKEDVERFLTEAAARGKGAGREAPKPAAAGRQAEQQPPAEAKPQPQAAPSQPAAATSLAGIEGVPSETREVSRMGQAIARRMTVSQRRGSPSASRSNQLGTISSSRRR